MSEQGQHTLDPQGEPSSPHLPEGAANLPSDVIAIVSSAAVTGKTTLAVNLAAALAKRGLKVLVVDLDRGRFATEWLRPVGEEPQPTVADVLFDHVPVREAIRETAIANVDVLAGSPILGRAEELIANATDWQKILAHILDPVTSIYAYILIDCPPHLQRLSVCALVASDSFIVPVVPHLSTPAEINDEMQDIAVAWDECEAGAKLLGIVLNQVEDKKSTDTLRRVTKFREGFKKKVFTTILLGDTQLVACQQRHTTIDAFFPKSATAYRFNRLAMEVLTRTRGDIPPNVIPDRKPNPTLAPHRNKPEPSPTPSSEPDQKTAPTPPPKQKQKPKPTPKSKPPVITHKTEWKEPPKVEPIPALPRSMMKSDLDTEALAAQSLGLKPVNLKEIHVTSELLAQIPAEQMQEWEVFPVHMTDKELHVALADPFDTSVVEKIESLVGKKVVPCFDPNGHVNRMIRRHCS